MRHRGSSWGDGKRSPKGLKLILLLLTIGLAGFAASTTIAGTTPSRAESAATGCSRANPCTPEECALVGAHGLDCVGSTTETTTTDETTTDETTTEQTSTEQTTTDETTTEQTTTDETTTGETTTGETTTTRTPPPPPGPPCSNGSPGGAGKDGQPGNDNCALTTTSTTTQEPTTTPATTTTPETTTAETTTTTSTPASTPPTNPPASGTLGARATATTQTASRGTLPFTGSRSLVIATLLGIMLVSAGIALRTVRPGTTTIVRRSDEIIRDRIRRS